MDASGVFEVIVEVSIPFAVFMALFNTTLVNRAFHTSAGIRRSVKCQKAKLALSDRNEKLDRYKHVFTAERSNSWQTTRTRW